MRDARLGGVQGLKTFRYLRFEYNILKKFHFYHKDVSSDIKASLLTPFKVERWLSGCFQVGDVGGLGRASRLSVVFQSHGQHQTKGWRRYTPWSTNCTCVNIQNPEIRT